MFKITFEYGSSGIGTGLTGKVVGLYAPSTAWTAHIGRGPSLVQSITGSKRIDDSSPAAMYAALGNIAATRPEDLLQFYQSSYSGSFTTDNGCSLSESGSERPDTSSAWLTRTKDGATLQFRTMELGDVNSKCDQWDETFSKNFGPADSEKMEEFFTFRLSNKDLANFGTIEKTNSCSLKAEGVNPGTAWGKATLTADIQPPEGEVLVEPDDYDNWVPKGNLADPSKRGNNLSVRVSVQKKPGSGRPPRAKFVFTLTKVSMQQGVCMNWPRKTAKADYGLKFLQEENPDLDVVGPDEARTKEYVEDARIEISAFDFGAWGILHITAKDELGRDLKIKLRGQDKSEMSIPLDENHNHIADGWELANVGDLSGQENDDQEDSPEGKSACPGDGLSLYEEYRGFRVQGSHVQADPKKKDLFIGDNTSGKVAAAGVDLFESATKLKVWRMTYEELGSDRFINRNGMGGLAHVVDQHGLLIEDGPKGGDPRQVPVYQAAPFGPPEMTLFVQLPTGGSYASGDSQADVAHELCHAVGLCHHGEENLLAVDWSWKLGSDGSWQLWEQRLDQGPDGNWIPKTNSPIKPIQVFHEPKKSGEALRAYRKEDGPPPGSATVGVDTWRLHIAGDKSQFSGDQECLMRYYDKQAYLSKQDPAGTRYLPDKGQWKMRTRLCTDPKGTGVNEAGHVPQSRYGDAPVGKCQSQLVINDKYAKK